MSAVWIVFGYFGYDNRGGSLLSVHATEAAALIAARAHVAAISAGRAHEEHTIDERSDGDDLRTLTLLRVRDVQSWLSNRELIIDQLEVQRHEIAP